MLLPSIFLNSCLLLFSIHLILRIVSRGNTRYALVFIPALNFAIIYISSSSNECNIFKVQDKTCMSANWYCISNKSADNLGLNEQENLPALLPTPWQRAEKSIVSLTVISGMCRSYWLMYADVFWETNSSSLWPL
jgi:hypothetical protein